MAELAILKPARRNARTHSKKQIRLLANSMKRFKVIVPLVAASKRKGLWVGGNLPLGYALQNRKLTIVANEAKLVRMIFQTYLKLGSVNRLSAELRRKNVRTKRRTFKSGRTVGGVDFTRGPLSYLLRNRFYIGEVTYKGEILPGPQPALISRSLVDAVQVKLAEQFNGHSQKRGKSGAPLLGKIFDDRGTLMGPTHTRKKGRKYRYYISSCLLQGRKKLAGSVHRVPAIELESKIAPALRGRMRITPDQDDNDLIRNAIERIDVGVKALVVSLKPTAGSKAKSKIRIPWKKPSSKRWREILLPSDPLTGLDLRPIRSDARPVNRSDLLRSCLAR